MSYICTILVEKQGITERVFFESFQFSPSESEIDIFFFLWSVILWKYFCSKKQNKKQDSTPAWPQEAYRPPRSKHSFSCLVFWHLGGGGGGFTPILTGECSYPVRGYPYPDLGNPPRKDLGLEAGVPSPPRLIDKHPWKHYLPSFIGFWR